MKLFLSSVLGLALVGSLPACASPSTGGADRVAASTSVAVVETVKGKLQGFSRNGILTFRGVQYATADRFMPPAPVAPWTGLRGAMNYGPVCMVEVPAQAPGDDFFNPHRFWPMNDVCQSLNVWTPSAEPAKKRPVMVWIHGGGFTNGSSIEQYAYDGENLARTGDVVVVSLNHRLNALGYLDLSAYGDKYKYSGNLGTMDQVAALQWIQANIARFGGDPSNVTVFGQSGGGSKILTLLAAPAAKGLFHKAIVESGTFPNAGTTLPSQKITRRVAELTLQNLGLAAGQVDQLQTLRYADLIAAAKKAQDQTAHEMNLRGRGGVIQLGWAPALDGDYVAKNPAGEDFVAGARDIPLLIGTTLNEFNTIIANDPVALETHNRSSWTDAETKAALGKRYGNKADAVVAAFLKAYPWKKAADAVYLDNDVRPETIRVAKLKADLGGAPVYNYVFTKQSPVLDGIGMSWHCAEIPYVFQNVDLAGTATGADAAAQAMADKVSRAWVSFARTGNPANELLPVWPAYDRANGATMILDDTAIVANNPDADLMRVLATP